MAKCIDKATLLLNQAKTVYSDICKIVNDTVDSMPNKVVIMKKSKDNTEMTPDNNCAPEKAGTNIKELNSIATNICANKTADDVIRFRIVSPDDTYVENVVYFTNLLEQNEHIKLQRHNFFTGNIQNPYIGINSKYNYIYNGKREQPFEIQYHTQWMSDAANNSHTVYKKAGSRKKQKKKRKTYRKRTK